jgi:hypothetical protein
LTRRFKRAVWVIRSVYSQMCCESIADQGCPHRDQQVFNATNTTITTIEPTREILQRYYPNVKITREMEEFEAPLSNKKIREVLGFKDEHDWRDYVDVEAVKKEMKQ